ncbi:hypothetical protein GJ496_007858 [Pomphorhynchus laevis]|nr:hypothetical protein GJ496_007858 [Pomphorhynchus laevis]
MKYFKTQRGAPMLDYNGFLYHISNKKEDVIRWRCKYRDCKGQVTIKNDTLPPISAESHTCSSNEGKNAAIIANQNILNRCKESNERFVTVFTSETKNLETKTLSKVTSFENMRDYAKKIRNERDNYTPGPENDIPLELQTTLNGFRFLQYDSGLTSGSRTVIFYSEEFLSYIKNLKVIIVDGTFKSSPQQFYQLVTIQGYLYGRFIPLIFVLLQEKSEDKYKDVFLFLKNNGILNPTVAVTDYERALFSSFEIYGDNFKSYGCLFHYGQCLWRKMQQFGLEIVYKTKVIEKKFLKCF